LSGELKMAAAAHIEFVVASYIAALVVIAALIVWVSVDYRAQRRTLADLETQGVTRRSAPMRDAAGQAAREDA
jgi:heme exporter protein D